jgi:hypothetical protein
VTNDQLRRLIRAAAVVRDGEGRRQQYVREANARGAAELLGRAATGPPPAPPPAARRPAGADLLGRVLQAFREGRAPAPAGETPVGSVVASFFHGQTSGREPNWESAHSFYQVLLDIIEAKTQSRGDGHRPPEIEDREVAAEFESSCLDFLTEDAESGFARDVAVRKLQRYTEAEIAQDLGRPVDEVRKTVRTLHRQLVNRSHTFRLNFK